jgi:hypothetical protein
LSGAAVILEKMSGEIVATWKEVAKPGSFVSPASAPMEEWAKVAPSAHIRVVSPMITEEIRTGVFRSSCLLELDPVGLPKIHLRWSAVEDFS